MGRAHCWLGCSAQVVRILIPQRTDKCMRLSSASRMHRQWTQLMDSSEQLVHATGREGHSEIGLAASRLLNDHAEWQVWEKEFGAALRRIVIPARRAEQIHVLRVAGFSWIHDAVPFRHLRDHAVRCDGRKRLIKGLHNSNGFARAMVTEHRNFIRSTCSFACSAHIGESIFGDEIFIDSMNRYREVYSEYFRSYCDAHFSSGEEWSGGSIALLPMLKRQAAELRHAILDYPRSAIWLERELRYRAKSGDTQEMSVPGWR